MVKIAWILVALLAIRLLPRALQQEKRVLDLFTVLLVTITGAIANTSKAFGTEQRTAALEARAGNIENSVVGVQNNLNNLLNGNTGNANNGGITSGTVNDGATGGADNGGITSGAVNVGSVGPADNNGVTSGQIGSAPAHIHAMDHAHSGDQHSHAMSHGHSGDPHIHSMQHQHPL